MTTRTAGEAAQREPGFWETRAGDAAGWGLRWVTLLAVLATAVVSGAAGAAWAPAWFSG